MVSNKLVVVVEFSQRDRSLLQRIADAVAPRTDAPTGASRATSTGGSQGFNIPEVSSGN